MPHKDPEQARLWRLAYNKRNREKKLIWSARWRAKNKNYYKERMQNPVISAKRLAQITAWKKANPDKLWQRTHPDRHAKNVRIWQAKNPEKLAATVRARQARKRRAMPEWLSKNDVAAIGALYAIAARASRETGTPHVVDHIVPLAGRNVSGLHVPWNLQVITAAANAAKANKYV